MTYKFYLEGRDTPVTVENARSIHVDVGSFQVLDIAGLELAKFAADKVQGWVVDGIGDERWLRAAFGETGTTREQSSNPSLNPL